MAEQEKMKNSIQNEMIQIDGKRAAVKRKKV